jgi:hypothetical protein
LLSNPQSAGRKKWDEKTKEEQEIKGSRTGRAHEIWGRRVKKTGIKIESSGGNPIDLPQIHEPKTESFRPSPPLRHGSEKKQKKGTRTR